MDKNINFSEMSNADINIKMLEYSKEYDVKKNTIIKLVHELEDLDKIYIKANEELKKRGMLNDA